MWAIRSVFTMFMDISTALRPLIVGFLIGGGIDLRTIIPVLFGAMFLISISSQGIKNLAKTALPL